ncbi:hypothetical protein [Halomicrococcus sp. SG-WS-1]|uniref:hypothetical protein n=1 Tax=Halomicrococcus sp. SG-WS-1 TaxID=3439057 RepID=UPI003F792FC4
MQRVSQATVLRHWLRLECAKPETPDFAVESLSERAALDHLLDCKPGAAAFVWRDAPVRWYRTTLSPEAFARLRVIEGPEGMLWRSLSPDGTVVGAARRVAGGDPDALAAETGVDVGRVLDVRENPPDEPLVLARREGCEPPYVADGNYRATARALALVETGEYDPVEAYLGVCSRPVLEPLRQRACALVRRALGRWPR